MIEKQKRLFKNGKIGLKDYWESFIVSYKIKKRTISQKIYKQENIREQLSWFLIDVYFEYEFCLLIDFSPSKPDDKLIMATLSPFLRFFTIIPIL